MISFCYSYCKLSKVNILVLITLVILICCSRLSAYETIYPESLNIASSYSVSSTEFALTDTLTVNWSITNNESYYLANLYFSDNLPSEFSIISSSMQINSSSIVYYYSGAINSHIIPSNNTYRWVIDFPVPDDSTNRILAPGDTINLEYQAICSDTGNYTLPFHTICCYGSGSGIFSTSDSIYLTVYSGSHIDENTETLPEKPLLCTAYPNPFNSEILFKLSNHLDSNIFIRLAIFDINGRNVFTENINSSANRFVISWKPEKIVAAGVYFYKLITGNNISSGKIVFLK
ncbi:MAG: T9SS type A sorting domain-containing protein [candidate division Zixibacteria bacterium]|nr:T9SS type A sorting domain-containing protein [candidate division Zixibacteria bacterium]